MRDGAELGVPRVKKELGVQEADTARVPTKRGLPERTWGGLAVLGREEVGRGSSTQRSHRPGQ